MSVSSINYVVNVVINKHGANSVYNIATDGNKLYWANYPYSNLSNYDYNTLVENAQISISPYVAIEARNYSNKIHLTTESPNDGDFNYSDAVFRALSISNATQIRISNGALAAVSSATMVFYDVNSLFSTFSGSALMCCAVSDSGMTAYFGNGSNLIHSINNGVHKTFDVSLTSGYHNNFMLVFNNYLLVFDYDSDGNLAVYDISDPNNLLFLNSYRGFGQIYDACIVDGYLYIPYGGGLMILNCFLLPQLNPQFFNVTGLLSSPEFVAVNGSDLFLSDGSYRIAKYGVIAQPAIEAYNMINNDTIKNTIRLNSVVNHTRPISLLGKYKS
jgi:hypothetical protein